MKIQSVSPSFTSNRRKIDVQGHVGNMYDSVHNTNSAFSAQNIIDTVEINGVKKVLVSSVSGLNPKESQFYQSETDCAKEIAQLKGNEKVAMYPLISCQPGITSDTSVIESLVDNGEFYGMKFHPSITKKSVKDNFEIYSKYLDVAEKKGLPCVFHSVTDGFSNPAEIIKLAEQHPKLPVVLYHIDLAAGFEQMSKTIDEISNSVKAGKSNLFVDISWLTGLWDNAETNKNIIKQTLEKIGAGRVLFGSDTPIAEMGDRKKYEQFTDFVENIVKETCGEETVDKVFYQNAEDLFFNKKWLEKPVQEQVKKASEKIFPSKGMLIFGGAVVLGACAFMVKTFHSDKNTQNNG